MIYFASPYSHPDPKVREDRYQMALVKIAEFFEAGMKVFSPIVYSHHIAERCGHPTDFTFWRDFDLHMIDLSDKVYVYMLPGWETSKGVQAEIDHAVAHNKEVIYLKDRGD